MNRISLPVLPALATACIVLLLSACGQSRRLQQDYLYFAGAQDTSTIRQSPIIIKSNDLLFIRVYSGTLNQQQAELFNLPVTENGPQGIQVSESGNIAMPVIGSVKAAGLTKERLEDVLEQQLANYVKSPAVIVQFAQFNVNVIGEVRNPGAHKFNVDRVTVIDALSAAGDLTDFGRRENVTVIREENGKKVYHQVDLRSRELFSSPVYVLQPNDIVYVSPNRNKLRNISEDPSAQRRTSLIFSITSVALGIAYFAVNAIN